MNSTGDAELLIAARSALLDALEALVEQRDALVLVGAQAIYLHTGGLPPFSCPQKRGHSTSRRTGNADPQTTCGGLHRPAMIETGLATPPITSIHQSVT